MTGAAEELAVTIGTIMGAGDGIPYSALSIVRAGGQVEQFNVEVHPRALQWSSTNTNTLETESFDPSEMVHHYGESSRLLTVERVPGTFPDHIKLAFPASLPIWGRYHDEYHPVSVEVSEGQRVILLRHQKDEALFASLSVDWESKRATRLVTESCLLQLRAV